MIEINKIYCENCLDTMARMPDGFLDLTVTSPPYDDMDENFNPLPKHGLRQYEGYTWDFKAIANELYRVTKDGGVVVWVVGDPTIKGSESLASSLQKIYFHKVGFNIHDTMFYQTNKPPLSHNRYEQSIEYMFVISKGRPITTNLIKEPCIYYGIDKRKESRYTHNGGYIENKSMRQGSIRKPPNKTKPKTHLWYYKTGAGHSGDDLMFQHPATFPDKLANDHIISWSNSSDLVYDPFAGSGTTAKSSILNNRNFIGSEIAPEYTPIYEKRIADALFLVGKGAKTVSDNGQDYTMQGLFQ